MNLKTQAEFSDLSLEEKNLYLQEVAVRISLLDGEEDPQPLSKEALMRLRRFYMRRRASDLALESTTDVLLRDTLQRMSEAVHLGEVKQLIKHEAPSKKETIVTLREPPHDDSQLSFFSPPTYDAPLKDDVNLMDVAPFSLSKNSRGGVIRYELPDAIITIEGGAETGLATAFDYDIFLHMVTSLTGTMKEYRIAEKKGLRPSLPPRCYRPSMGEILSFARRGQGGRQYERIEGALDRLQATRIKITNLNHAAKRRASESFPLIGRYKVISRTKGNKIDMVEIDIPDWVYKGVVNPTDKPSVLTLDADYFLIAKPLARFIYRLARKSAGTSGMSDYGLETVHLRSGSALPFAKFRKALQEIVEDSKICPLPEFNLEILPAKGGEKLRMTKRTMQITGGEQQAA
ncbi:replication initiator protein A [Hyphomicrobium sp.]|uniref:replication initiator protein A n=1 Tax=Hyphomicrobium sp. TaxID=82 RepID=UPI002E35C85A|nr:replication initiator protein A [Hyphomicrobium sp.]HEX2842054.1 replication initiator protein A [Hyphomicrobium sp.]